MGFRVVGHWRRFERYQLCLKVEPQQPLPARLARDAASSLSPDAQRTLRDVGHLDLDTHLFPRDKGC